MDVDSDNTAHLAPPDRSDEEDEIEMDCKYMAVNDNDDDRDGIPDYADGYNRFDSNCPADDITTNEHFVPIVFEIDSAYPLNSSNKSLTLTYMASDPAGVSTNAQGQYAAPTTGIRIWTKPGDQPRDGKAVLEGGSFLQPNVYTAYEFGFRGNRTVTYYVEGLTPAAYVVTLSNSPPIGYPGVDEVKIVVLKGDLVPDWDHNRMIEESDRGRATLANPYRFWINDDADVPADNGDMAVDDSDVPGQSGGWFGDANYSYSHVRGRSDLEDFFPVWLEDWGQPLKDNK